MAVEITLAKIDQVDEVRWFARDTFVHKFGKLYKTEDLNLYVENSYSNEAFTRDMEDVKQAFFLATLESRLVGFVQCGPCELPQPGATLEDGEIKRIYVHKDFQGKKIGEMLMRKGLEWLHTEFPNKSLFVGVWSENFGAQKFYSKFGFDRVGEYYFKVGSHRDYEFIMRLPPSSS